jgi:outer membrane protein TolC
VRADQTALQTARLSHEPTYSLQASDTRSNDQTSFSRLDTIQASVSFPLTDGGLAAAQVREAQAALAQAQAQAETARKTALTSVSAAYLTAQSARSQVEATREAQDVAQVTYDKTVRGYQNGLFPLINVLNAQTALAQARAAYVQALYDAMTAQTQLDLALSGAVAAPANSPSPAPPAGASPGSSGTPPNAQSPQGASPAGAPSGGNGQP